ncbi:MULTISPECIES: nucleoside phosphorylase [Legionella]|uniref:Nucleoside phosphorylase domain-containing protein n=1 Tax=Legionella quinlivanii TaxID=45073 RepID=A0A364LFY6_9GAMM|nr:MULTISPECIES: nucleoside phosphorylase [Legionella]MCE3044598.1 nucleoside phosphorylase [Legionella sp. 16cNR16C]RAP35010.1 hypothetical protein B1207_14015 [Legionella quinlivanii]
MPLIETQHINASHEDFSGNNGIGRYIFLTGSDERARELSEQFEEVIVRKHPRQHNFYMGKLLNQGKAIDVAAISTGMGGPSADIIINELIMLGARRLLRIGTAGSLQPDTIHVGDIVVATAAVRDDKASWDYIYREYPAIASMECLIAAHRAARLLAHQFPVHFGIVHSKSSLYAREFHYSFMEENDQYMKTMHLAGILATEMECAQLFTLSSLMSAKLISTETNPIPIFCGCILAIVGDKTSFSDDKQKIKQSIDFAMSFGLETVKALSIIDQETHHDF